MFELDDIQAIFDDWGSGYPWKAEYIPMLLALANAYGQQFPQRRDDIVEGIQQAFGNGYGRTLSAVEFRQDVQGEANMALQLDGTPAAVAQLQFAAIATPPPAAPAPPVPKVRGPNALDLIRQRKQLKALRNQMNTVFGEQLANQAERMEDWFDWTPTGADPLGKPAEEVEGRRNDFGVWLNRGQKVPPRDASLNCWEAVMMTAFLAGLAHVQRLRLIHAKATAVTRGVPTGFVDLDGNAVAPVPLDRTRYAAALERELGGHRGVTMNIAGKKPDMPRRGDLVFLGDMATHVAISVGRQDDGKYHQCMSLWHHNHRSFTKIRTRKMATSNLIKVIPCPFPL